MANNDPISTHLINLEVYLSKNNSAESLNELNKIIDYLKNDNSQKEALIVYINKRININFELSHYQDVLKDCQMLNNLGEDIYKNKSLFLMREQSFMELFINGMNMRFSEALIQFGNDEDIKSIAHRIKSIDVKCTFERTNGNKLVTTKKQKTS